MTAKLLVRQGGGGATVIDFTSYTPRKGVPFFDENTPILQMGQKFNDGEASQGYFLVVDPEAEFASDGNRYPPHVTVRLTEDASGTEYVLAYGRIGGGTDTGRAGRYVGADEIEHSVGFVDCNTDLRGIPFRGEWSRPAETHWERLQALHLAKLNGSSSTGLISRATTDITVDRISNGHLIRGTPEVDLDATDYPAGTEVSDVIRDIAEQAGMKWGVVLHHSGGSTHRCLMMIEDTDHTSYTTAVKISDQLADWDPDHATAPVFEPHWMQGKGKKTENDYVISGLVSIYGGSDDEPASVYVETGAAPEDAEVWVDVYNDGESDSLTVATRRANAILAERRLVRATHQVSILVKSAQTHLLTAGQSLQIKSVVCNSGVDKHSYVWRRIAECRFEPAADDKYWVHLSLERPRLANAPSGGQAQPKSTTPKPGTPPTPGTCTRYYFSADTTGVPTVTRDASWDAGNGDGGLTWKRGLLKTTATSDVDGSSSWGLGTCSVPRAQNFSQHFIALSGTGTLEGTVKAILHARRRTGVGVTSSQRHQAEMVIRVVSNDGSTVRGIALADHDPGVIDSPFFTTVHTNRKFPASATWGADGADLTPVNYQDGDWIVVELGSQTIVDGSGVGANIWFNNSAASDLEENESGTSNLNSWLEICTAGTAGSDQGEVVNPGEEDLGDDCSHYACVDHTHAHGLLAGDSTHMHSVAQVAGLEDIGESGGPHSHPDYALDTFAITSAPDGGWGRVTKRNIITYGDYTYISFVTSDDGDARVAVVANSDPSTVLNTVTLHAALEVDDHAVPSLLVRESDHKLLTAYCAHGDTAMYTRLSTTSLDTDPDLGDGFAAETDIDTTLGGSSYTFAHLYQLTSETNDPIWLVYREGANAEWFRSISTDSGATWGAPTKILTQSGETPYLKAVGNGTDRLDFAINNKNPSGGGASIYHAYYTGGTFYTSDSTAITLPIDSSDATLVADGSADNYSVVDVAQGIDGEPVILWADISDTNAHVYHWSRWTGTAWTDATVATGGEGIDTATETFPPGAVLDADNPTIVYASRENAGGFYDLWQYTTPDGEDWQGVLLREGASNDNNYRPQSWANHPSELRVVWTVGSYTGFTTWSTGIYGAGLTTGGGVTDHGALTGLADDDHTQYLTEARHTALSHEDTGHYEVIVSGTAPPVAVTNEAEDDWLYGWVSG